MASSVTDASEPHRLLRAVIGSGLAAGLVLFALQQVAVVPLINRAEGYERHESHEVHDTGWEPRDGAERTAYTALGTVLTGIAFAAVVFGVADLAGLGLNAGRGAWLGVVGYLSFVLAPGVGLPPKPPGVPGAAVESAQLWWTLAATATFASLLLVWRRPRVPIAWGGSALMLALPHLIGAPAAPVSTLVPRELVQSFVLASTLTRLPFWLLLGVVGGHLLRPPVARRPSARLHSRYGATLFVVATLTPSLADAQTAPLNGIVGVVTDPLSASMAGAVVRLLQDDHPVDVANTDGEGGYAFTGLRPGRYRIVVAAPGFQQRTMEPVFVGRTDRVRVDVSLPLGPLESAVSVTAAATEVLPSQVGSAVTVLDAETIRALGKPDVLDALRFVPGSWLVQTGGRGGTTAQFIRGGQASFNRVIVDGIPVNDIGGAADLAQLTMTAIERIEVIRQASTLRAGPDALAGVVAIDTRRGRTSTPALALGAEAGTLRTHRESASIGGVIDRLDYFGEASRFETANAQPNNRYRVTTFAGRAGMTVKSGTQLTATLRGLDKYYASPNAMRLFATPDDAWQTSRMTLGGGGGESAIGQRWLVAARVGLTDQRTRFLNPAISGEVIGGAGYGLPTTIAGANGYSVTGRGILDSGPYDSLNRGSRRGAYAQATYEAARALAVSAGGTYEREHAFVDASSRPVTSRSNGTLWMEGRGALADRASIVGGLGIARIEGYATRVVPRLSVAVRLRAARPGAPWGDIRLSGNAGTGIKGTNATSVARSLYRVLSSVPGGDALLARSGIGPIAPERSRSVDVAIEQGVFDGRVRARASYFDNRFLDLVEFVGRTQLPAFGVPTDAAAATGTGAYVNSQSYSARGVELSVEGRVASLRLSSAYTYLDAQVTASLSNNVSPQFNPRFPGVPIGGFTALVGARPFRRPAHTGHLLAVYTGSRFTGALSAYMAGRADDSTYLVNADESRGNTLLMPNRDLNAGYARVDFSAQVAATRRLSCFAAVENVLATAYQPAFGFPGLPVNVRTGVTVLLGGR